MVRKDEMRKFPAKIMLFGEYSVLLNGRALVLPYHQLFGTWMDSNKSPGYDQILIDSGFNVGIESLKCLNTVDFFTDKNKGVHFNSSIPIGAGLGSSGAFCAAVFDKYGLEKESLSPSQLHHKLLELENIFHGTSSGVDPLVSYYQQGVEMMGSSWKLIPQAYSLNDISLIDSGLERRTKELVNIFKERMQIPSVRARFHEYLGIVSNAIHYFTENQKASVDIWKQISMIQLELFAPMIPSSILQIWEEGLNTQQFHLKLCGAGGGGYFLCQCADREYALKRNWIPIER